MRLEDAADRSRLYLPHRLGGFEVGAALIGWAIVALFFYGAFMLAWQGKLDWPWVLFNGALTLSTAGALLHAKIHLEAIELRSDQVRFVVRYGIFLRRAVRYRRQGLHFEGDYQSLFSMDTYQSGPDFKISVNRHCFFCMTGKRPFYLLCDEVQGGWIIEGLNAWARAP